MSDPHRKDGSIRSSRGVTSRLKRSIQFGPGPTPTSGRALSDILEDPTSPEELLLSDYVLLNPAGAAGEAAAAAALAVQAAADAAALAAQTAADAALFACPTLSEILVTLTPAQKQEIDDYIASNPQVPRSWSINEIPHSVILNQQFPSDGKYIIPTYDLGEPPREPILTDFPDDIRPPLGPNDPVYKFIAPGLVPLPGENVKQIKYFSERVYGQPAKDFIVGFESYNITSPFWRRTSTTGKTSKNTPGQPFDGGGRPLAWSEIFARYAFHYFSGYQKNSETFYHAGSAIPTTICASHSEFIQTQPDTFLVVNNDSECYWALKSDLIPAYYSNEAEAQANNWLTDRTLRDGKADDTFYLLPNTLEPSLVTLS
jgi:hypothetical protein